MSCSLLTSHLQWPTDPLVWRRVLQCKLSLALIVFAPYAPALGSCLFKMFTFILCNSWWKKSLVISQPQGTRANLICGALLWCLPGSWCWLGSWYSPKCCHTEQCFSQLPCVQQAHVSWEGVMDFKHFQLPHSNCAGCSDGPLQQKRKCSGEREGRGSSQLQTSAMSLCCEPREGKGWRGAQLASEVALSLVCLVLHQSIYSIAAYSSC